MKEIIGALLDIVWAIIEADGDADKEEEALMVAQEVLKAELDRRKFGTKP